MEPLWCRAKTLLCLANTLTVLRLFAIPAVVFLLCRSRELPGFRNLALAVLICQQASDILDGFLARRAKRAAGIDNPFGQIMDPVADKLYIGATYATLTIALGFPKWVTIIVISRDFFLAVGFWIARAFVAKVSIRPNTIGKITDTSQAFLIFAFLLDAPGPALTVGMSITVLLTFVSWISYVWQGISEARVATR